MIPCCFQWAPYLKGRFKTMGHIFVQGCRWIFICSRGSICTMIAICVAEEDLPSYGCPRLIDFICCLTERRTTERSAQQRAQRVVFFVNVRTTRQSVRTDIARTTWTTNQMPHNNVHLLVMVLITLLSMGETRRLDIISGFG